MSDGLGRAASRGALVTLFGQGVRITTQLISLVVLARLLPPADFGLVAIAMAVIGVADVLRDFGLVQASVQSPRMTPALRNNLFWINTCLGVLLALVVVALAPLLAMTYDDARLTAVAAALAATFPLNGISAQYRATLNRDLRFAALTVVEIASAVGAVTIAIFTAMSGLGYWALVLQIVSAAAIGLVTAVAFARWIPGLPSRSVGTRRLVTYGANLLGAQLLGYASRNFDTAAIGFIAGPGTAGLYSRAFEITMAPLNQVQSPSTKVALPTLARLQSDPPRFGHFLIRGQAVLLLPLTLALALLAFFSTEVVIVALGATWSEAAPYITILAIGAIAQACSYATYWVFLAHGLTGSNLRLALVSRPLTVILVLSGALLGPFWVAAGYSLGMVANWLLGLVWISRARPDVPTAAMLKNGLRISATSLISAGAGYALSGLATPSDSEFVRLMVGLAGTTLVYGIVLLVFRQCRNDFAAVAKVVMSIAKPRR